MTLSSSSNVSSSLASSRCSFFDSFLVFICDLHSLIIALVSQSCVSCRWSFRMSLFHLLSAVLRTAML